MTFTIERALFFCVFFLGYTLNAITGFAGNVIVMPAGIPIIGLNTSIAVLNATGFISAVLLMVILIKDVVWKELIRIVAVMLVFMAVGIWLDTILSLTFITKFYGVFILAVALKSIFLPSHKTPPTPVLWVCLCGAGVIQGMLVSGGPLLVIYALQRGLDKQQFRATLSAVWTVLNGVYLIFNWQTGVLTPDALWVIAICIPLLVLATVLGNIASKRLNQATFLRVTYFVLLVVGVITLIR